MSLKIGIITYHFTTNYGATLQAYALSHFLTSQGYDVEFIDYRPKSIRLEDRKYLYPKSSWLNPGRIIEARKKILNMNAFVDKHLKLSQKRFDNSNSLKNYKHQYDVVICGSDEIWNINYSERGLDTPYFIDFISGKDARKVSYAPSFGSTNALGIHKEKVYNFLKEFYAISVRDNNSLSLLNHDNFKVTKVVDPTFLVNYDKIIKFSNFPNKYILVYGCLDLKEAQYVKTIAEKEGLDIISIGSPQKHLKPFLKLNLFDIAPEYWLGYFYNASLIFTKFFHGVVFSIIFNKNFIVFTPPEKKLKVRDILNPLGLESRLLDLSELSNLEKKINHYDLNSPLLTENQKNVLNHQIEISKNYLLSNALK